MYLPSGGGIYIGDVSPSGCNDWLTILDAGLRHLSQARDRGCYLQGWHITLVP
jgi:hypothetical protein